MLKQLLNEEDDNNPTILIQGFGTMDLKTARAGAITRLKKALAKLESNPDVHDWANAKHILYDSGVVESMITSIIKNHPK